MASTLYQHLPSVVGIVVRAWVREARRETLHPVRGGTPAACQPSQPHVQIHAGGGEGGARHRRGVRIQGEIGLDRVPRPLLRTRCMHGGTHALP